MPVIKRGAGPFRGLAAFGEGDAHLFLGREEQKRALEGLLGVGPGAEPILITGECGAGKTSFIKAVVLPLAQHLGLIPLYLDVGPHWEPKLRDDLARYLGRKLEPAEPLAPALAGLAKTRGRPLLFILDHLEQLSWLDTLSASRLDDLVAAVAAMPTTNSGAPQHPDTPPPFKSPVGVQLLFAVQRDSLEVLGGLRSARLRIATERRISLDRLTERAAGDLLEQIILAGGGYMEAGLPELIAAELAEQEALLPADLQKIGHGAVLEHALTVKAFRRAGGVSVISTLYAERLARRAGGWQAHRVLAVLAEPANPRGVLDPQTISAGAGLLEDTTVRVLERLVEVGLVRAVSRPAQPVCYGLIHPHIAQSVRNLVAPLSRGKARARLALKKGRPLLGPADLMTVWRYLGRAIDDRDHARLQRSRRLWLIVAMITLALPFIAFGLIYAHMTTTAHVSVADDSAGVPRVVLRSGDPGFGFAFGWSSPPFGRVIEDTGVAFYSLAVASRERLRQGVVFRSGGQSSAAGLPPWAPSLLSPLSELRKGAWLMLAGREKRGSELLLKAAETQCLPAARMLSLLSPQSPSAVSAITRCLKSPRPTVRFGALALLKSFPPAFANAALKRASADRDGMVRQRAIDRLISSGFVSDLDVFARALRDKDVRIQRAALRGLQAAAADLPAKVYRLLLAQRAHRVSTAVMGPVATSLKALETSLIASAPKKLVTEVIEQLKLKQGDAMGKELLEGLEALHRYAHRDRLKAVVSPLLSASSAPIRGAAHVLYARFGATDEVIAALSRLAFARGNGQGATRLREAAAKAMGVMGSSAAIGPKAAQTRRKILGMLVRDRGLRVRRAAVASLMKLGSQGASNVVREVRAGSLRLGRAALYAVCGGSRFHPTVVTAVLGAAWSARGGVLRARALGCARSLARLRPRLAAWLAYQAATAKDAGIRQAAAPALALALARGGRNLRGLARGYLRDPSADVRRAVVQAIGERPPKNLGFLMPQLRRLARSSRPALRAATAKVAALAGDLVLFRALLRDSSALVRRAAIAATPQLSALWARANPSPARVASSQQAPGNGASAVLGARRRGVAEAMGDLISRSDEADALAALDAARSLGLRSPILKGSAHPEPAVRARALALSVETVEASKLLALLVVATRDASTDLQLSALRAIAARSSDLGRGAVAPLERATHNKDPRQRWAAFEALGSLQGVAAAEAVKLLEARLKDPSEEIRRLAVRALARLASTVESAGLALLVGSRDAAHDVRVEARSGLAAFLARKRNAQDLWSLLVGAKKDGVQRRTAVAALAYLGRQKGRRGHSKEGKAHQQSLHARIAELKPDTDLSTLIAARLAAALTASNEPPEEILSLIYGW